MRLTIVGTTFGTITVDQSSAALLLGNVLGYPADVIKGYTFTGPPDAGETQLHFTLRDAAAFVRAARTVPAYMFVWDFIALDGAGGRRARDRQRRGRRNRSRTTTRRLGELLAALADRGLIDGTNILFTLDHGKVDTHKQVVLGTHGAERLDGRRRPARRRWSPPQGAARGHHDRRATRC